MGRQLVGGVVAAVAVVRAGLVEVVAVLEAASWPQGPPAGVERAGLVLVVVAAGVAEAEAEAEGLGQEAARVGVSPPATGVLVGERHHLWMLSTVSDSSLILNTPSCTLVTKHH